MVAGFNGLAPVPNLANDEPAYRACDIRAVATEVIEIALDNCTYGALLAVVVDPGGLKINFALFEFAAGVSSAPCPDDQFSLVFHGEGYGAPLREMRHSYWGENGYLFYADRQLIARALEALGKWFD